MSSNIFKIAIIGGGAAGFFAAQNLSETHSNVEIHIFEGGKRVLEKVRISGGGRCNVTHSPMPPQRLIHFYPRGKKELLGPFHRFNCHDTINWFESRGVKLHTEADGRVFPETDVSETIIECLTRCLKAPGVFLKTSSRVTELRQNEDLTYTLSTDTGQYGVFHFVIYTTGSHPSGFKILHALQFSISNLIPSLFTFRLAESWPKELTGLAVRNVRISMARTRSISEGDLLFTHWGISGPAVLKMSSFSAQELHDLNYQTLISINWLPSLHQDDISGVIDRASADHPSKLIKNTTCFSLPGRLWHALLAQTGIAHKYWSGISKKEKNKLISLLGNTSLQVTGKSTFKEEFVTCGGVELREIDLRNFESKKLANFYLAGEVLNIDALTGGFNFQAAWTGAWHVAQSISGKILPGQTE